MMLCALAALMAPGPGRAALGGGAASVSADQKAMGGTLTREQGGGYTVQQISTPAALVVREYLTDAGAVFAVTWRGPLLPDLHQLLGDYFDRYRQAADEARAGHGRRGMLAVRLPDLVVQSGGHMRAFFGRAYLPGLVPPGVQAGALR